MRPPQKILSPGRFAMLACAWLCGAGAPVVWAQTPVPIDIRHCRSDSACGYFECHGDNCQCCYRSGGDYECADGSCLDALRTM